MEEAVTEEGAHSPVVCLTRQYFAAGKMAGSQRKIAKQKIQKAEISEVEISETEILRNEAEGI